VVDIIKLFSLLLTVETL